MTQRTLMCHSKELSRPWRDKVMDNDHQERHTKWAFVTFRLPYFIKQTASLM